MGTSCRPIPDGAEVVFCGPWLGELGVEMVRWVPYLRSIRAAQPEAHLVAGGYANSACLYRDFADEFWVLDEGYRHAFLNRETSFNYGVFHELSGNDAYREHAARKGFDDTSAVHREIGAAWFAELERRRLHPSLIVSALGESRAHRPLSAGDHARHRALELLERKGAAPTDGIVMLLPRLRALQGAQRSWSPTFYRRVIGELSEVPDSVVIMLGSRTHEASLAALGNQPHVLDAIGEGLDVQLAFWERSALGSGPPSGGLVPGYFTGTPLLHWYKPGLFPTRHGRPWNELAERDYEVFGITSEWIEVDEAPSSAHRLVGTIAAHLDRTRDRTASAAR